MGQNSILYTGLFAAIRLSSFYFSFLSCDQFVSNDVYVFCNVVYMFHVHLLTIGKCSLLQLETSNFWIIRCNETKNKKCQSWQWEYNINAHVSISSIVSSFSYVAISRITRKAFIFFMLLPGSDFSIKCTHLKMLCTAFLKCCAR